MGHKKVAKKANLAKKATLNSKTNQPGSSKQAKEMPEPWKQEAEARVRMHKQYGIKDIKVFEIDISATKEEFEAFMEARVNHIRREATTFVNGAPVTAPYLEGFVTYHIVRVTDKKGGGPSVELLFQEYNLYFIAFRITTEDSDPSNATRNGDSDSDATRNDDSDSDATNSEEPALSHATNSEEPPPSDATGWLAFLDAVMPDYLEYLRVNYTVSYDKSSQDISLGFGVTGDIYHILLGYTIYNRLDKSAERELVFHTTPYMMSELLRLGNALQEVGDLILRKQRQPLTLSLVNCWGNISRVALRYGRLQDVQILNTAAKQYKLQLCSEGSTTESFSKLVGADGYLRVLLYNDEEVEALLKKRQKDNPPTTVLELQILGQGQRFDISEVERKLWEECSKHGNMTGFLVDGTQKILVKYSHPRGASEAKMHLDGSLVGKRIVEAKFSNEESFFWLKESCKGTKVQVQPQSGSIVEFSASKQTPQTVQDFMSVAAKSAVQIAAVEEDVEPSDNQILVSDHFIHPSVENVRCGKQSVEQEPEEPALLHELHLLASVVRSVPSIPGEGIAISSSLIRRLGKIVSAPQLEYYNSQHGNLANFLASHQELFVVNGDLIYLRQGAHQRISAQIATAKVKAASSSKSVAIDLQSIAVTPHAPSTQGKASRRKAWL